MIKNIIVFGGSGLIGQEIIKYLEKFNLNILNADLKKSKNINVKFKDEMLETNSIIWSGSGNTKFTQDRYIEESKKYGTL